MSVQIDNYSLVPGVVLSEMGGVWVALGDLMDEVGLFGGDIERGDEFW